MIANTNLLYCLAFCLGGALTLAASPFFRRIALRYNVLDRPNSPVKTHTQSTPYLGGCAIALAFFVDLTVARLLSNYPDGTLKPIRGVFLGGLLILFLGLVDDTVEGGLSFKTKFLVQFAASAILVLYDIQIHFIHPHWLAVILSLIWITGVMNAINITDIMDGLAGGISVVAALAFLFISLPTEHIYVNLTASVLAGAVLGFLPYNFSKKRKMFMGDAGSLLIGYVLAALSLGTSYSTFHNAGVIAPILILGVPIYDTFFVMLLRLRRGMSPFLGSRDHFALRLERMGYSRKRIVLIAIEATLALSFCAWLTTWIWFWSAVTLYGVVFLAAWWVGSWLAKVPIEP